MRTHKHEWRKGYNQVYNRRAPYLRKQTPTQQLISHDDLAFQWEKLRDEIQPERHPVFEAFIDAPSRWCPEAERLADLEWNTDKVGALFEGLKKTGHTSIGVATLDFYADFDGDPLTDDERSILVQMDRRRSHEANDEEREFYERHEKDLSAERSLKARWERYVFGAPIECDDFQIGLLNAVGRLLDQTNGTPGAKRLRIQVRKQRKVDWLKDHAYDAVNYFCHRYRGLPGLIGGGVDWDVKHLFQFDRIVEEAKARDRFRENTSSAKQANQIKFDVYLHVGPAIAGEEYSVQVVWTFNPKSVLSEFVPDMKRLVANTPMVECQVSREPVSVKGGLQSVDLSDCDTLMPVYRRDRGALVAAYESDQDIGKAWLQGLEQALSEGRVTTEGHIALKAAWQCFEDSYRLALSEFLNAGVGAEQMLTLGGAYEGLLGALQMHAPGDRNRVQIWQPIMRIGLVRVAGGTPAAIVPPWHPLRLLAMAVKARQISGLIAYLLANDDVNFGDARLFFQDLRSELADPYYPEVAVGFRGSEPRTLCVSDVCGDYTLMEPPIRQSYEGDATSDNPTQTARDIRAVVQRYVELQPHERANLSVVLYNCDSARLPEATVEALGELYGDEEDVRCEVILRHRDRRRLTQLYEALLQRSDTDVDSFVASEASRDFMARLRIGIMADEAPLPKPQDGPPRDLVFMQDVIARLASQAWHREAAGEVVSDVLNHYPPRWSRRKPAAKDDLRSVAYLACPAQPAVGWRYLDIIRCLHTGAAPDPNGRYLPVRELSFQSNETREIFEEVHRIGQWVVNYDDLLDKRQLKNQGVQIIRYQQKRSERRNVIISSKAPVALLDVMVSRQLQKLNLGLPAADLLALSERMRKDATDISGDIMLRAAKRGRYVSELLGLVLSRFIIQDEIGESPVGWYFMDDYAYWLGQREEHLADILAISPSSDAEGGRNLILVVSECKYVDADGLGQAAKRSQSQLRQTVSRIHDAILGDPSRLDRDLWLSRVADMILDGIELPAHHSIDLGLLRNEIRNGKVRVLLRGYSHVFASSGWGDREDPSERIPIPNVPGCWQEVYGQAGVRELVLAYHGGTSPRSVREGLGPDQPWNSGTLRLPSDRVSWAASVGPAEAFRETEETEEQAAGASPAIARDEPVAPRALPSPARRIERVTPSDEETPSPAADDQVSAYAWARAPLGRLLATMPPPEVGSSGDPAWLSCTATRLSDALRSYGLQARIQGQRLTPNAALVVYQGTDRLTEAAIESRRRELLTTHGLNITGVIPGPGTLAVAVARPRREVVSLLDVWKHRELTGGPGEANVKLVVGLRESDSSILYLEPALKDSPHTLIAGATGSGKSVLLQNLILDIACTNDPSQAQILLIDPKQGLDFAMLASLPHLVNGVRTDQAHAAMALESVVAEMNRRMALLAGRASNVLSFNKTCPASERLPVLWVIHDEFAAWMVDDEYKELVSNTVKRLGMMARAAGIFLIFAAQRPEAAVMTAQLRANLDNRLVLRVASEADSEMALGCRGAERLLGKGHLAARLPESPSIIFAQVPILTSEQLRLAVEGVQRVDGECGSR